MNHDVVCGRPKTFHAKGKSLKIRQLVAKQLYIVANQKELKVIQTSTGKEYDFINHFYLTGYSLAVAWQIHGMRSNILPIHGDFGDLMLGPVG